MSVKQISVYAENKKGSLAEITGILAGAGIDLKSICVADTAEFGLFRMIVSDADAAVAKLKEEGFTASARNIAAVAVPNAAGALNSVLQILAAAEVGIEYMYSIISSKADKAYMALRVEDNAAVEALLTEKGFEVLTDSDI